ncbi:hypothetical protein [Stenotrophomonas maltophilia group sp. Smal13]|jgi:hypothetical protein|uniref:hypothetical protein n=1 Tax=Stenotrophomonas maltophilia group sp. Smal13 TaxID=3377166 RepID=UPI000F24F3BB|nr:hypothetical protein [Stenotrophomonas maltophilia]
MKGRATVIVTLPGELQASIAAVLAFLKRADDMKTTHRNSLLAALLVCLTPVAVSANEAYLTPNTNGGSGAMPSGYSKLYFELGNGNWVGTLKLPAAPRQGDTVVLSSMADWNARLETAATAFDKAGYLPVDALSNVELRWSSTFNRWDVIKGESARLVYGKSQYVLTIPASHHAVTQVGIYKNKWAGEAYLPTWAPQGAVLVVANETSSEVIVSGYSAAFNRFDCKSETRCAFVFDADGKWRARMGREQYRPVDVDLPSPGARWTDVVVGSAAEDVTTPGLLRLPANAVDGDIYQISNPSNELPVYIAADNSNRDVDVRVSAKGYIYRYDGSQRRWIIQPN